MTVRLFSYQRLLIFLLLVVSLFALSFIVGAKAFAASYYINNTVTCSDTNAGTAQTSGGGNGPWCNISNVTGKTFAPGDQILLARGATWTSQVMRFTNSGTASNYITLDAYGTGNRPIIRGSGLATTTGLATDIANERAVVLTNASYWNIRNLEISRVAAGLLFKYTTLFHEGINISNIYVHHINGIVRNVPANTDSIYFSSGIVFTGSGLTVGATDYVVRNITIDSLEGTHNQNSISINWFNGALGGTNPENATQNVTMNRLYLHDDDGNDGAYQSTSCSDGLAFIGTNNATLMDSVINNEASCHAPSGTAAIFVGKAKNIKFINNIITNVPNTNSNDETGLDLEIFNDSMKFYSNYWGGNNGAGFECLLINGANDWCSNNDIGGNIFVGNGEGGIKSVGNGGGVTKPTGIIHDNIFNGATAFLTTLNGGSWSQVTETNTKTIYSASRIYSAPVGFSGTQGTNAWSYQYYNGSVWANLAYYDAVSKVWQTSSSVTIPQVSQFGLHPASTSTQTIARTWTAPTTGSVSIRGQVLKSDTGGGNGIVARITKNGTRIWPAASDQTIAYNDRIGVAQVLDNVSVTTGDVIRFEVNSIANNNSYDMTSWAPTIAYTSTTGVVYDWGFDLTTEGWTNGNQLSQAVSGGINTVTSSGTDPVMYSGDNLNFSASAYKYVKVKLKNNTSSTASQLFFTTTTDTAWTEAKSIVKTITASDSDYKEYLFDFSAVGGWTGTIKQLRWDPVAAAGTVNVDYIRISDSVTAPPVFLNAGFEAPSTTTYIYGPMTNGWTFDANGAGVQRNGSVFGAATAPEGVQTAFLQNGGSISQPITFAAGTYSVNFKAAKRATGGTQSFNVLYDTTVIGSFTPSSTSFTSFNTSYFTATAGSHTIKFVGTNTVGDNTDFIDEVKIN